MTTWRSVAEARFHGLRLIDENHLRIVEPHESVLRWFSWMHLTPEEYAASEDFLAEIIVRDSGFLRSRWGAFAAWLGVS